MSRSRGGEAVPETDGHESGQNPEELRKKITRMAHWEWLRLAFELDLEPAEKLVLVAYATHANVVGDMIYPSKNTIAWKTNMTRRHVRTLSARLVSKEILLEDRRKGTTTRYRLNPDLEHHPKRVSFAEWEWRQAQKERKAGGE